MLCIIRALLQAGLVVKFWPHNLYYSPGLYRGVAGYRRRGRLWRRRRLVRPVAGRQRPRHRSRAAVSAAGGAAFLPELKRHRGDQSAVLWGRSAFLAACAWRRKCWMTSHRSAGRGHGGAGANRLARCGCGDVPLDEETRDSSRRPSRKSPHRTLLPYSFARFCRPAAARSPNPLSCLSVALRISRTGTVCSGSLTRSAADPCACSVSAIRDRRFQPPAGVQALAGDAISVRANVSDAELRALYRTARVAAVPLRYGAGVKLKVVEALREGLPLVTTSIGAQGLPGLDDVAAIHDEPAAFADACLQLLTDGIAWAECSTAQVEYAAAQLLRGSVPRQPDAGAGSVRQPLCGAADLVVGARGVHLRPRRHFRHGDIPPVAAGRGGTMRGSVRITTTLVRSAVNARRSAASSPAMPSTGSASAPRLAAWATKVHRGAARRSRPAGC